MADHPSTPVVEHPQKGAHQQDPSPLVIQMMQREIAQLQELRVSELEGLRRELITRLDGMDKALSKTEEYPTDLDRAVTRMREYTDDKIKTVDLRFTERDKRFDIRDEGNSKLLEEQRRSSKEAITKAEESVGKQLDSQQRQIDAIQRLMDRGEGKAKGTIELWAIIVAVIMITGTIVGIVTAFMTRVPAA